MRSRSAPSNAAVDRGITLIDTAPVYGFGHSEEIVGKALAEGGRRAEVIIATKVALDWKDGKPFRNASRTRIMKEIDDSLRRLQTDVIDLYQVHWPDPSVPIEETAGAMKRFVEGRKNPRHRRQQFLSQANGSVPRGGAAAYCPAALQSVRTRSRAGGTTLCRPQQDRDAGLWRALPRSARRQDDGGHEFSGRRSARAAIRNSGRRASSNICRRSSSSIVSRKTITANASSIWLCDGF